MQDSDERIAPLELTTDLTAGRVLVTVRGEVDHSTADQLRRYLEAAAVVLGARVLVLDLRAVGFFGSPGLSILLEAADEIARRSSVAHPFRVVVGENRYVIRPIRITGLQSVIRLHHDLGQALADHRPAGLR